MAEARRYGIKLVLSLANNYESYGGKKQYVNWARNQGQYLTSDDDFFRNPVVKGFYKNHVKVSISLHFSHTCVVFHCEIFWLFLGKILLTLLFNEICGTYQLGDCTYVYFFWCRLFLTGITPLLVLYTRMTQQ